MNVITYFCITLSSILIQYTLMELLHESNEEPPDPRGVSHKLLYKKNNAIYYNTKDKSKTSSLTKHYSNDSITEPTVATDTIYSSTMFDYIYDENVTITENILTTESVFSSTEIDNVTDITLFEKKKSPTEKTLIPLKPRINDNFCECDLLYEVCDINCCCDSDCNESQRKIFKECNKVEEKTKDTSDPCKLKLFTSEQYSTNALGDLFCITAQNVPKRRNVNVAKYDMATIRKVRERSLKWKNQDKKRIHVEFSRKPYVYGDPLWLLKNDSIYYMDLPTSKANIYCSNRSPVEFMKNVKSECVVKLSNLEMFRILEASGKSFVVSPTVHAFNSSAMNCSTLHCAQWAVLACVDGICTEYNKTQHEPSCTVDFCTNIALNIDYIFQYQDSKIVNATIKLQLQEIDIKTPFMIQVIDIKFYFSNKSVEDLIELSGNVGYIKGLPIIISTVEQNYTYNFFNSSSQHKLLLPHPNTNGECAASLPIEFGINKRIKCQILYKNLHFNNTKICNELRGVIERIFDMNKMAISPFGNPVGLVDKEWLYAYKGNEIKLTSYGKSKEYNAKPTCYGMITGISLVFAFADVSEVDGKKKYKIIDVNVNYIFQNVTINVDNPSIVLTVDTSFLDVTKPPLYEYAGTPRLNIHLPADFFIPNNASCDLIKYNLFSLILVIINIYFYQIK